MRILTEKETGLLSGNLQKLGISKNVALYSVTGIPQVYRQLLPDRDRFQKYLSIPYDYLLTLRQQLLVTNNGFSKNKLTSEPLELDEYYCLPVLIQGQIPLMLIAEDKDHLALSKSTKDSLLETAMHYTEDDTRQTISQNTLFEEFVSSLFQKEIDTQEFIKQFIKLLDRFCPGGCGAYYYSDINLYKLRIVVGDINAFDAFPGLLENPKINMLKKEISRGNPFIPTEFWQQDPIFTDTPPRFNFCANGIQSDRTDYLLMYSVNGCLTPRQADILKKLTMFASQVHDNQFLHISGLLNIYHTFTSCDQNKDTDSVEELLKALFLDMHNQLGAVYLNYRHETEGEYLYANDVHDTIQFLKNNRAVSERLITHDSNDHDYFFRSASVTIDPNKSSLTLPNIENELCLPLPELNASLSVGFPYNLRSIRYIDRYFNHLKKNLLTLVPIHTRPGKSAAKQEQRAHNCPNRSNLLYCGDMFHSLTGGFYNQLQSLTGVLVGQLDILKDQVHSLQLPDDSIDKIFRNMNSTGQTADEIAHIIQQVQELSVNNNRAQRISCKSFIKKIPQYLRGLRHSLKEQKNLNVRIETDISFPVDFELPKVAYFSSILPTFVTVFNNFEKNGVIRVTLEQTKFGIALVISWMSELTGKKESADLLSPVFAFGTLEKKENSALNYTFDWLRMTVLTSDQKFSRVVFTPLVVEHQDNPKQVEHSYVS